MTMQMSRDVNSSRGIMGSVARRRLELGRDATCSVSKKYSQSMKSMVATPPTTKQAMTFAEFHFSVEPQLRARRRVIPAAMKKAAPTQSIRRSFCFKVSRGGSEGVAGRVPARGCAPFVRPRRMRKERIMPSTAAGRLRGISELRCGVREKHT